MVLSNGRRLALLACLSPLPLLAQQPYLGVPIAAFSRTEPTATLYYQAYGRPGDAFVLLADTSPGPTQVLGQTFDLGFSAAAFHVTGGVLGPTGTFGALPIAPAALPPAIVHLQFAALDLAQGLASVQASTSEAVVVHDAANALVVDIRQLAAIGQAQGDYDAGVLHRLEPEPAQRRTVRPLPQPSFPFFSFGALQPIHLNGARIQWVLRAADLLASGRRETLTSVRWRPQWGLVVPELLPQFELRASLTDVVPDYSVDPWSALPEAPLSGLSTTFADNPRAGTTTVLYSGPYAVLPTALQANGYLPFPAPQGTFRYDGASSLLLETACAPVPGGGVPQNQFAGFLQMLSAPEPYGTVAAVAGLNGNPSPLSPAATTAGTGGAYQFDLELEFLRTESIVTTGWITPYPATTFDYLPAQVAAAAPPGTSLLVEYRGTADPSFGTPTAWSTSQDVADGLPYLQFRVTMQADATGTNVPWLDKIVVPLL